MKGVISMVALYIEIRGPIDSKKLFEELEELGNKVNVTDMDKTILVYATLPFISAVTVLSVCSDYGDIIKSSINKI